MGTHCWARIYFIWMLEWLCAAAKAALSAEQLRTNGIAERAPFDSRRRHETERSDANPETRRHGDYLNRTD